MLGVTSRWHSTQSEEACSESSPPHAASARTARDRSRWIRYRRLHRVESGPRPGNGRELQISQTLCSTDRIVSGDIMTQFPTDMSGGGTFLSPVFFFALQLGGRKA